MLSPAIIVSIYYFLVFLSLGSVMPFYPLWFKSILLSEQQIGIVAALPALVVVLISISVGNIADRARDWRTAIIVCNVLTAVTTSCLFYSQHFAGVLVLWTLSGALLMVMSPVLDAASIRMARQRGIPFHKMRACGSLGFIVGVMLSGFIFDQAGIGIFMPVMVTLAWLRALTSLALPRFRAGIDASNTREPMAASVPAIGMARKPPSAATPEVVSDKRILRQRWFLMVLIGSAMIHASHGYFYTFGTVIWTEAGYSATTVSMLWAAGVLTEVAVMWLFSPLAKQYSARKLLAFAGAVACLRWGLFGTDLPFALLLLTQSLHGVTFGILFLATVNFIANWTAVSVAAQAQSLSGAMNTGLLALMTLLSGYVYAMLGISGYWIMFALCLVGILFVISGLNTSSRSGIEQT